MSNEEIKLPPLHQVPVTTYTAPDGETRWPAYSHEQRQEYASAAVIADRAARRASSAQQVDAGSITNGWGSSAHDDYEVWARSKRIDLALDIAGRSYHYPEAKASWGAWQEVLHRTSARLEKPSYECKEAASIDSPEFRDLLSRVWNAPTIRSRDDRIKLAITHIDTKLHQVATGGDEGLDAKRYRWWRTFMDVCDVDLPEVVAAARTAEELDAAIDAILAQQGADHE